MTKKLRFVLMLLGLIVLSNGLYAQCSSSSTTSTCNNNGTITLNGPSGAGPFVFEVLASPATFTNPGPTTNATSSYTWNGCNPGTYSVQISDGSGVLCTETVTVSGNYADPTAYNPTTVAVTGCINGLNGEIHGVLTDGLAPYSYEIMPGSASGVGTINTTGDFTGLSAGNYQVRAYDDCGNFVTQNLTIAGPSYSVSSPLISSSSCTSFSLDGLTISALPPGGSYKVKQGSNVLGTSATLPIAFTSTKNDVNNGAISICITDACGDDICTASAGLSNDWTFTDAPSTVACGTGVTINSLTTTGSISTPYTTTIIYTSPAGTPTETIPGNTVPYTLTGVTAASNPIEYTVRITDACGAVKDVYKNFSMGVGLNGLTSASCTTSDLSTYVAVPPANAPINFTISPDPNAIGTVVGSAGQYPVANFPNLPDNSYVVTATDACGKTSSTTYVIGHDWDSYIESRPNCKFDTLQTRIGIPGRSKSPVVVTQYDGALPISGTSTIISTQTYSSTTLNNNPGLASNNIVDFVNFENTLPNQTTSYILVDDCGRTDTVTITNGAVGHQPLVHSTEVTPKCINKGNLTAHLVSDAPADCFYASYWNITTPATVIASGVGIGCGTSPMNTIIATDVPVGTYVIKYNSGLGCANSDYFDTVIVEPYKFPKVRSGAYFACSGGSSNVVVSAKFGVKPYQYRIINTVPSGTTYTTAFSSSNVFTLPVTETLVNVQVLDDCGNTATKQIPLKPAAAAVIKTNPKKLNGCTLPLNFNLFVDSTLYPGATYEWVKTAGAGSGATVIGTAASLPAQLPSAVGTYTCRVVIPGTCFDKTSTLVIPPSATTCLNEIGNYVWNDTDKDGTQDANEVGVAGVTVTLYNASGSVIATTVTDAYGKYLFTDLPDGSYGAGFTPPSNYIFSPSNTPGDNSNNTNSDADPTTGKTTTFALAGGESDLTVDAGIYQPQPVTASLGNFVWFDADQDGLQDASETGVAGVTVTLYGADGVTPIATTVTDASGHYQFNDLAPGTFSVGFTLPPTYVFTGQDVTGATANTNGAADFTDSDVNPTSGKTSSVTLVAGENNPGLDAGIYQQNPANAALGNKVWYDVDNDGIQDPNEAGVPGVTVTLYAADGTTIISTATTDELGNYMFNNLSPADYVVGFSNLPSGFNFSPENVGNDALDSDPSATTGKTSIITLRSGEVNLTVDAGINNPALPLGGLGTTVWYDRDNDGVQDTNENGVPGVTVTLYDNAGTAIGTTVTDNNGNYSFNNLPAGNYSVGFTNLPAGYGFTATDAGGNDATDSDPNGLGRTVTVPVGTGFNPIVDGGIVQKNGNNATASLGDRVWNDVNNDGIQDANEQGVAGVTVTLYGADGTTVIATTTTDALGNYIFTGLNQGDYIVGFSNIPSGFTFSAAGQGTDPTKDANADASTGGKTSVIHLATGEENLTIDAGIHAAPGLASLGNYVWIDENQDGIQDASETGIAGVSVTLYDNAGLAIATTTTDANGFYQFTGLTPGTYSVGFANLPDGYNYSPLNATGASSNANNASDFTDSDVDPATGRTAAVTLAAGENNPGLDAGIFTDRASLGNYVWNDLNNDGIQDPNEKGIPGITVSLYDDAGILISTTVTDANGKYNFVNLEPGDYQVGFSGIPAGSSFSPSNSGTDDGLDSDVDPTIGLTPIVSLLAGENNPTIDAGIHTPQSCGLGNYVWRDFNGDGIQDPGEPGIGGVTVTLYDINNNPIKTTVTDQNGFYTFADLAPGTYSVGFSNIPKFYNTAGALLNTTFSPQNSTADGNDSDADVTTGKTGTYTLVAGEYNPTVDAGIIIIFPVGTTVSNYGVNQVSNRCNEIEIHFDAITSENNNIYAIQRKHESENTYNTIKTLTSKDAKNGVNYVYVDKNVRNGSAIYRVELQSIDNSILYTNTIKVDVNCNTNDITVYPNPTTELINIEFNNSIATTFEIKIVDMIGKTVKTSSFTSNSSISRTTISMNDLPNGVYHVIINNGSSNQIVKVVKQ